MSNTITNPPTLPFSPILGQPKMDDLFNLFYRQIMIDLNCHALGTIKSFDSSTQTAQVTFNYTKSFFYRNQTTGKYQQNEIPYALIQGVPVVCLSGGNFSLTFPIQPGDQCLLLFNDRDMDNWFANSDAVGPVNTVRMHSIADALAIVGLHPSGATIPGYDTSHALLQNGETQLGISETQVRVANAMTTLGTAIGLVNTALTTFAGALVAAETAPTLILYQTAVAAAATALSTAIATAVTSFTSLLE